MSLTAATADTKDGCADHRVLEAVHRWIRDVPLYRSRADAGFSRDWNSTPFLTKADMGAGFPSNFLREGEALEDLIESNAVEIDHTSGTSGPRQPLILGVGWWRVQEGRALALNGFIHRILGGAAKPRRGVLASPSCASSGCYVNRPSVEERAEGLILPLSLNRFPWLSSGTEWTRVADEIEAWQPVFLEVDPVYGAAFARFCARSGRRFPSIQFIITSYEFASGIHRRRMGEVFGVPIFDLYGSTETGHLLMEDENGRMRPSVETAWLEVVDQDEVGIGELVATTLTNEFMPLIRYRTGDLVERCASSGAPAYRLHGRAADALQGRGGRRVTVRQADDWIAELGGLWHYDLRQTEAGGLILRYIADCASSRGFSEALRERFRGALGVDAPFSMTRVDALIGEPSGKFRLLQPRIQRRPTDLG
jgi:phenylacetate-CoA ligase